MPTNSKAGGLQDQLASALRRLEALESAYESTTVGQLCSLRARTHGWTVAIDVFERGEQATYAEMDQKSNLYARALRAFGVRKGDRVGVMLPNRIEFPLLWFAIAKLGAVMLPINMRYTPREIEYVLSDAQARLAIVDQSAWPLFCQMDPWPQSFSREQVIVIGQSSGPAANSFDALLEGIDGSPVEEDVLPDDLLNIQYTSGTTGLPKGCMLTHEYWSVASYQGAYWDREPYQRYMSAQPFFYADPQSHLLKSYRQGGTLYLAPQLSSTRFIDWVKRNRIEWCSFPELVARQSEGADDGATSLKQVSSFSWGVETIRRFRERFHVVGQNGFGMTEIAWGTLMPGNIDDLSVATSVGIRAPLRKLRIVNEDGSPTPVGKMGELWLSGRGIFRGYWNRPEANAAAFEGEWFKTGDLFRQDEAGFWWLVGRTKDVIRRSSENIAAREVEAVIREIPGIEDVAAVPVRDTKRGEEVKVFVELKKGLTPDDLPVERILDHARAHLAVFKVPRYVTFIPTLPRTVTNTVTKVLKRELTAITDPLSGVYDGEEKRWR